MVVTQVWPSNHGNGTLSRFNPEGTSAGSSLSGNGLNGLRSGVVMGPQVWIPNINTSTLSLFNQNGTSAGSPLTGNGLNQPHGIAAVGGNQVWVVNAGTNVISRWQH